MAGSASSHVSMHAQEVSCQTPAAVPLSLDQVSLVSTEPSDSRDVSAPACRGRAAGAWAPHTLGKGCPFHPLTDEDTDHECLRLGPHLGHLQIHGTWSPAGMEGMSWSSGRCDIPPCPLEFSPAELPA